MSSWEELMPNTYARMKHAFFERCKTDKEFREKMIKEGILEVKVVKTRKHDG